MLHKLIIKHSWHPTSEQCSLRECESANSFGEEKVLGIWKQQSRAEGGSIISLFQEVGQLHRELSVCHTRVLLPSKFYSLVTLLKIEEHLAHIWSRQNINFQIACTGSGLIILLCRVWTQLHRPSLGLVPVPLWEPEAVIGRHEYSTDIKRTVTLLKCLVSLYFWQEIPPWFAPSPPECSRQSGATS